jgi:hypothetical protein
MVGFDVGGNLMGETGGDDAAQPITGKGASVTGSHGRQERAGLLLPATGTHALQALSGPSVTGHLNGGIVLPGPDCVILVDKPFDMGSS